MTTPRLHEPPNAPSPGIYRHYKGAQYRVLGMARHSETEEWLVVYQALYGEHGFWVRPLTLWLSPVSDGTTRFTLIEADKRSLSSFMESS